MSLPLPHPFKQAIRLLIHAVLEFGGLSVSGKIAKEAGKVSSGAYHAKGSYKVEVSD